MTDHLETTGTGKLLLFCRFPEEGRVKTRLIPGLGAAGATRLYRRLAEDALANCRRAAERDGCDLEVWFSGGTPGAMASWLGNGVLLREQPEGDLGQRMAAAFAAAFDQGAGRVVLVGSDCPGLTPDLLSISLLRLRTSDVVLGPALDGGYYLIGLRRQALDLFEGIPWGGDTVLAQTVEKVRGLGFSLALLPELADIDRPADLKSLPPL